MNVINITYILALAGVWIGVFITLSAFSHEQRKKFTLLTIMVAIWMSINTIAELKQNGF